MTATETDQKKHFWLHHHTAMSPDVSLKNTLLILLEDYLVLGCPGLRWMFSDPDLLQQF